MDFCVGRRCNRCRNGYWDLASGEGCQSCNCDPIGSSTGACDEDSGQCECLPGVTGQRCDQCLPNHYGLNKAGCAGRKHLILPCPHIHFLWALGPRFFGSSFSINQFLDAIFTFFNYNIKKLIVMQN